MEQKHLNGKMLEHLFREYFRPLTVFALTLVKDQKIAEDIVQDLFYCLFDQQKLLKHEVINKNYLYKSVYNRCLNSLKFQKVRSDHNPIIQAELNTKPPNPFEEVAKIELEHKFLQVVESMPPKCRTIFKMSRLQGKKNQEIAEELNLSKRTVETQISMALKALRKKLRHYISN